MTHGARAAGRATWALVALLLLAAAVAAGAAGLAARAGTAEAHVFGPAPQDAAAGPSGSDGGRVLAAAPVVPPSGGPGSDHAPAPLASVGSDYAVGSVPFRPARLVLPAGRSAPIAAVGLHADGSLVVPDDPRVVGWWTGGAMPGDGSGSVVVAGHVDTARRGVGVLAALTGVRAGDVVELTAGRRAQRYRVVSATLVPQAQLSRAGGLFRSTGDPQLVLITCGGAFDPVRHRYADNYVVVARPAR